MVGHQPSTCALFVLNIRKRCTPTKSSRGIDKEVASGSFCAAGWLNGIFGWMIRWWRLAYDYKQRIHISKVMIHVIMESLLLRRISH